MPGLNLIAALLAALLCAGAAAAPRLGPGQVAELLEIAGTEKQPEARRAQAIRQLEHTDERVHLSLLRRLLREERSPDIRLAAACTLAAHGDRKSPLDTLLATAYEGERTASCSRTDVIVALGRTENPAAEFHLDRALKEEAPAGEPYFHSEACRALVRVGTPSARARLVTALRDGSPAVRHAAVSPLASLCVPARTAYLPGVAALRRAAREDPDEKVAEQAASALLWSGVDGAAFFRMLEADPDPRVRSRAARVMNRHYLTPERLARLRAALAAEPHPEVRAALETTLRGQRMSL
jgi:HEAT repeat protein